MTKEKKTFQGKIDGTSEVTETKKEGLFRFGVKANNDWYGFSGTLKDCQAEHEPAQEAKDKGHVVAFTYTEDGKWLNITKVGSWNVEGRKDTHEPASTRPSDRQQEAMKTDPDRESKIAEAYRRREREALVIDMAYYLSVAKDAWVDVMHPFDNTTTHSLDATDKEAIEKIAVHLRMNKKGR